MGKSNQQLPIAAPIVHALTRLESARQQAVREGENLWNHAVSVESLSAAGLSQDHLTWMDQMGWIELGYEVGTPKLPRRVFAKSLRTAKTVTWCAIMTSAGLVALRNCRLAHPNPLRIDQPNGQSNGSRNGHIENQTTLRSSKRNGHSRSAAKRPKWDERTRELRLGKVLVKRLRCHAPNQILILSTFQEEGWPRAIDDPLPPNHEGDARRRLSDTIKALNRNQATPLLRFRSNGTGEVVTWEQVAKSRSANNGHQASANNGRHRD